MYHGVRDDRVEVSFRGQMKRYLLHHVMEFDPTRKRMSVIIQDEDGQSPLNVVPAVLKFVFGGHAVVWLVVVVVVIFIGIKPIYMFITLYIFIKYLPQ